VQPTGRADHRFELYYARVALTCAISCDIEPAVGLEDMNRIFWPSVIALAAVACVSSDQLRRREYDDRYQQALKLCGQPDVAFQAGYNAGYGGSRMQADWTSMCVPEAREAAFAAYQNGFLQGANNAPLRVVHTVSPIRVYGTTTSRPSTSTSTSECTFDSDCGGDGWHCRSNTCMGYGSIGDRCVFNDDCTTDHCFGGTCRE
jgi:hypothetical protein